MGVFLWEKERSPCELAPDGAEFVVGGGSRQAANGPTGWKNAKLRNEFHRIVIRAGLNPWAKLFQNLKSSRETELAEKLPIHVVIA